MSERAVPGVSLEVAHAGRPPQFAPVTQIRAHEYVAEQIRRHITLRLSGPGELLPPERELVKQFGVGRPTIQMALRLLEAEHLIEVRRGRGGGTFIVGVVADDDARFELVARVHRRREEIAELLAFRATIEPAVVAAAAEAHRKADLRPVHAALRALDRSSRENEYMRYDTELHLALAAATHNRYLVRAGEEVRNGLNDVISLLPESKVWHGRTADEHHEIVAAVEQRDGARAAKVMTAHIEHTHLGVLAVLTAIKRRQAI